MSRSQNNDNVPSPVQVYWEWKGTHEDGRFSRHVKSDKEGEKGKNIGVKKLSFMVLEQMSAVTGYNEDTGEGIYSNEVLKIDEDLKVYMGRNVLCEGKWKDIKDKVKVNGGKFAKNVYALGKLPDGGSGIVRIMLAGSALKPWFEFCESNKVTDGVIVWSGETTEGKKGSVKFDSPVFSKQEAGEEEEKKAIEADKLLIEFFKSRAANEKSNKDEQEPELATAGNVPDDDDEIPF